MTKAELVNQVQENSKGNLTKKASEELVNSVFEAITNSLTTGGKFAFPGFGTFTVKERAARKGRNPKTGEEINIIASKTVGFKPASRLKETLN
jgi:DNA-binding protein HU-beta